MVSHLTDAFLRAFELSITPEKPIIYTVENAGNWKALTPLLHEKLNAIVDTSARCPVIFGGEDTVLLKQSGSAGIIQFESATKQLLNDHERIFVFDAQRIDFFATNPNCIEHIMLPGRLISFFFRGAIDKSLLQFIKSRGSYLYHNMQQVSSQSISVISTQLSEQILKECYKTVSAELTETESAVLKEIRGNLFEMIAPEIEDNLLGGSFGVPKLRELARRKFIAAVLKATTPTYSTKSGRDPIDFFREELADRFKRYELPTGYLSEVSPYLSFVVKSQHKYANLKL